jgi:LssY C-terminus
MEVSSRACGGPATSSRLWAVLAFSVAAVACAGRPPAPIDALTLARNGMTQDHDGFRVSVFVPEDDEAERLFGTSLASAMIQAVGLVIENHTPNAYWFAPLALDPDYFTPIEVANRTRGFFSTTSRNEQMRRHFLESAIGSWVGPGGRISGFVFTNLSRGVKPVNVELLGAKRLVEFYFMVPLANLHADYQRVDLEKLRAEGKTREVGEAELRAALEALPCCATTEDGRGSEDPLNFVLVGQADEVFPSFARTGWHVTEVLKARSALETFWSYFFSSEYKYAPISPIYLFGRHQDIALQKARETARERNHLRVWRMPLTVAGKPVWVGQISRDVGLVWSWKSIVGHEVDPDVDEARNYLAQDLLRSQRIVRFGWVQGVGAASTAKPHHMADGSPFFTDGLRLVLWLQKGSHALDDIQLLGWETPPPR